MIDSEVTVHDIEDSDFDIRVEYNFDSEVQVLDFDIELQACQ
jgi:hypothetical protein